MQIIEIIIIAAVFFCLFGFGGLVFFKNSRMSERRSFDEIRNQIAAMAKNNSETEKQLREKLSECQIDSAKMATAMRIEFSNSLQQLSDSFTKNLLEQSDLQKEVVEKFSNQLEKVNQSFEEKIDFLQNQFSEARK